MARVFLSPAEQQLLADLPADEAAIVRALYDLLDAHLEEEPSADEQQQTLFHAAARRAARPVHRTERRAV